MVEVRQRQRGGGDVWSDTLRPFFVEIVHKPDETVAGLETTRNQEVASSLRDKWDAPIKEENYVLDRGREIAWKMANRARTACIEKYSALCDTQV
ncbi:hypothetical protein YC2023_001216 [Brassica napus]